MFTALHPLLLWGAAAVAVPILIHLLLRQRPRPRPWAAMRWLLAAAQAAQRRYRLTNLLLLLMRCLIILLIALAVARPSIAGLGGGDRLVLIVDRSASMGARGNDPGPLAAAKAELARAELDYHTVVLVAVDDRPEQLSDGTLREAQAALGRLDASELPGGLDRIAAGSAAGDIAAVIGSNADVILISDFQQDDGQQLAALLAPRCRSVARWAVGAPCPNAAVAGIATLGDLRADQPGELVLRVTGSPRGAAIAADDGAFLPLTASASGGLMRLTTPPLNAGEHRLRVRLDDDGLAYDNLLELPVTVRPAAPVLVVTTQPDFLSAALAADANALATRIIQPAQFAAEPLPAQGLVALRAVLADGARLAAWVKDGGVLWAQLALLREDAALRALVIEVTPSSKPLIGGAYASGEKDIDEVLGLGSRASVPGCSLPSDAEVLLRAGAAPLVVAVPAGRGWVVVELAPLAEDGDQSFQARGTTPLWIGRTARRLSARLHAPRFWQAGLPVPTDVALKRAALALNIKAGELLRAAPGAWNAEDGTVVVLPNADEGRLAKEAPKTAVSELTAALPQRPGADWGLPLAIAALLLAIAEGLVAAWAGKTYGR